MVIVLRSFLIGVVLITVTSIELNIVLMVQPFSVIAELLIPLHYKHAHT